MRRILRPAGHARWSFGPTVSARFGLLQRRLQCRRTISGYAPPIDVADFHASWRTGKARGHPPSTRVPRVPSAGRWAWPPVCGRVRVERQRASTARRVDSYSEYAQQPPPPIRAAPHRQGCSPLRACSRSRRWSTRLRLPRCVRRGRSSTPSRRSVRWSAPQRHAPRWACRCSSQSTTCCRFGARCASHGCVGADALARTCACDGDR